MAKKPTVAAAPEIVDSIESLEAKLAQMREAQGIFATYSQEQVDKIFYEAAMAANKARIPLAKMAIEETGRGVLEDVDLTVEIASDALPDDAEPRATITLAECNNLSLRIKTAVAAAATRPIKLRIELTGITGYGTFTSSDAQTLAVRLLDGLCDALSD